MKTLLTYSICFSFVFLHACKKEQDNTPVLAQKKVTLKLAFPANALNNRWEFIVSTANGAIILDTIADKSNPSTFEFYTNEKKLDLTFIYYHATEAKFYAGTFRDVDPRDWDNLSSPVFGHLNFNKPSSTSPSSRAKVNYMNPPAYSGSPYFFPNSFTLLSFNSTKIVADYTRRKDVPAYLLLPDQGLCKIHIPKSDNDTIDLTSMEKVVRTPFDFKTAQIGSYAILYGITDTTDRSKDVELGNFTISAKMPDLLYPIYPFHKYDLLVGATSSSNEFFGLYSYEDTIPKVYNLMTSADYSLRSSSAENFSIDFTSTPPFYYMTQWSNSELDWSVYSPVNLNNFRATAMLEKMKNKLLNGVNTSSIRLNQLVMERSVNIDYSKFLTKAMVSSELNKTPDYQTVMYAKTF